MDKKESEKDISSLGFDKNQDSYDNKFLVQRLKRIKEIINLLEKKFLQKKM